MNDDFDDEGGTGGNPFLSLILAALTLLAMLIMYIIGGVL